MRLEIIPNFESEVQKKKTVFETPRDILEHGGISNEAIQKKMEPQGLTFDGKREKLSGGFLGPLYLLEAKKPDGTSVSIVEKTFARDKVKRFSVYAVESDAKKAEVRSRLRVLDIEYPESQQIIIDWLYNEEKALRDLEGIPGIPKSYGAVYEGLRGSMLEEYIDGFDLTFCDEHLATHEEIDFVFNRIRETYIAAAKRGYLFSEPAGATIMVDATTKQPYLIDWYHHSSGSIESTGAIQEMYQEGLKQLEERRNWTHESLDEKQKAASSFQKNTREMGV